jgi:predicted DNA-binding antitoxin AbrB/MazE fold protein
MDTVKVGLAVQSGVSVVCATCKYYWEGREKGLEGAQCTVDKPCGSPLVGMDFPFYCGPIDDFGRWCFVCGSAPLYFLSVPHSERVIGICEQHLEMLKSLRPVSLKNKVEVRVRNHRVDTTVKELLKHPKTLIAAILQTEAEWADVDG